MKDGKPAEPGDPAENVVDGNYQRPLNDFRVLFREIQRSRPLAEDRFEALTKDNELQHRTDRSQAVSASIGGDTPPRMSGRRLVRSGNTHTRNPARQASTDKRLSLSWRYPMKGTREPRAIDP